MIYTSVQSPNVRAALSGSFAFPCRSAPVYWIICSRRRSNHGRTKARGFLLLPSSQNPQANSKIWTIS